MISVFIVDDHPAVVEGIKSLLSKEPGIKWAGEAINAGKCIEYFETDNADVLFMDINLPDMNGVDLCKIIKQRRPGINIIGLSTLNESTYIKKMIESGAGGYVLKNAGKEDLLEAIEQVLKGETYLSLEAAETVSKSATSKIQVPALTRREKEVLGLIAKGFTNPEIGEQLYLSTWTVDSHRKSLHAKFKVKNTAMLIRYAIEHKFV